jgi:gluconate 2-dehydrogenase gamma chain
MSDLQSRRTFLRAAMAAGAAWAATAELAQVEEALAWTAQRAAEGAPPALAVLTPAQVETLDAVSSRILPSVDGKPGAHEAGAVYFIDRSLSTFNAAQKKIYVNGIADLDRRASQVRKTSTRFAALTSAEQDRILGRIETTPFFQAARFDTIVGTFAMPMWGGNRDYAGWQMLGLTHQMTFSPPFGFYDADANRRS